MVAAELDRCRAEAVEREHAGHRAAGVEFDERQIAAVFLADFGFGDAELNTGDREKLIGGGRGVIDGHSNGSKSIKAPRGCLGGTQ